MSKITMMIDEDTGFNVDVNGGTFYVGNDNDGYIDALKRSFPRKTLRVWEFEYPQDGWDLHWRDAAALQVSNMVLVPWHNFEIDVLRPLGICHYAYPSIKRPGLVAFTLSEERGILHRHEVMKPGKYLNQYYKNILTDTEIIAYINAFNRLDVANNGKTSLHFARTRKEIQDVYVNGPKSCMSAGEVEYDCGCHPTEVYASGDLAVAYMINDGRITARCLCWPEKKRRASIYGDSGRFIPLLEKEGYLDGNTYDFYGAKLLAIKCDNGGYAMPYLDICGLARLDGDFFVLSPKGNMDLTGEESGVIYGEGSAICERCEEHFNGEEEGADVCVHQNRTVEIWCDPCTASYTTCCPQCGDRWSNECIYFFDPTEKYLCPPCFDEAQQEENDRLKAEAEAEANTTEESTA